MRFVASRLLVVILGFLGVACSQETVPRASERTTPVEYAQHTERWLDTKTPASWLSEGAFDQLDAYLDNLYQNVRQNPEDEYRLVWTYIGLLRTNEAEKALRRWLKTRPHSNQAKIAYAGWIEQQALKLRNELPFDRLGAEDLSRITAYNEEAQNLLREVLDKLPDHPVAHYFNVHACADISSACLAENAAALMENAPHAYFAQRMMMTLMRPQWGGSLEMIQVYQHALYKNLLRNPHWNPLLGFDQYAQCEVYQRQGDDEKAFTACQKALSFAPDLLYLSEMAGPASRLGRFRHFREYVDRFRSRFPSDFYDAQLLTFAETMTAQGVILEKQDDTDAATMAFNEAQKISPRSPAPYFQRGLLYYRQGDLDRAEKDLQEAARLDDDLVTYRWLSFLSEKRDRTGDMVPVWQSYLERHPEEATAYFELARCFYRQHDFPRVYANVEKACALGDDRACAWENRLKNRPSPQ